MGLLWKIVAVIAVAFSTEIGRNLVKSLVDKFWRNDAPDLKFDSDNEAQEKERE